MEYFKITESKKKTSELLNDCSKLFPVYCRYSDEQLDKDFPPPDKITTRYFEKNIEADEKHKNKSANDCEKEGVKGITLRERIIMELQYFKETGQHLDIDNITLCVGSRFSDGNVPDADWDGAKFKVDWDGADNRFDDLRPREAVSLEPSSSIPSFDLENRLKVVEADLQKIRKFLILD